MKKNLKNTWAKVLSVALVMGLVVSAAPAEAAAKPKLSAKKVTITKGKTKKVTVKKVKKVTVKKVKWSVNKKGNKVVKLSKKSKKGVTIKGLKKGSATVTAKVTYNKKKTKKLTVKVTVKNPDNGGGGGTTASASASASASAVASSSASAGASSSASAGASASASASAGASASASASPSDDANKYVAEWPNVTISEYNEAVGTKGKEERRTNVVWDEDAHTVKFTSTGGYNGGLMLCLDPVEQDYVDVSEYRYVKVTASADKVGANSELMLKLYSETGLWDNIDNGHFTGETFDAADTEQTFYFDIGSIDADLLSALKAINVTPKNVNGEDAADIADCVSVTISEIKFTNDMFEDADYSVNVAVAPSDVTLDLGEEDPTGDKTAEVEATVTTDNCTFKSIAWTTSKDSVATVKADDDDNKKATITGVAIGDATITATVTVTLEDGSEVTASGLVSVKVKDSDAAGLDESGKVLISQETKALETCLIGSADFSTPNEVKFVTSEQVQYGPGGVAIFLQPNKEGIASTDAPYGIKVSYKVNSFTRDEKKDDSPQTGLALTKIPLKLGAHTTAAPANNYSDIVADYPTLDISSSTEGSVTLPLTKYDGKTIYTIYVGLNTYNCVGSNAKKDSCEDESLWAYDDDDKTTQLYENYKLDMTITGIEVLKSAE